jgi:hypothetical protein
LAIPTLRRSTPPSEGNNGQSSEIQQVYDGLEGTVSNQQLLSYLNSLFEAAKKARFTTERQWFLNLSYYFGRQWVSWLDPGGIPELSRLYEPKAPPWRVRLVINRIRPMIRTEMSKVLKEKPTAFVIPASSDESDVLAARAGEQIFEHLWRVQGMKQVMWQAQFWRATCGIGYVKEWWDPKQPDNRSAPLGQPLMGSIMREVPSPFHIYPGNLQLWDVEDQPYMIHVTAQSPDEVEANYGVKLNPDTTATANVLDSQFLSALNLNEQPKDFISVMELWIKPCMRFPVGALVTWAGSTLLNRNEPMPFEHGEYPFTKFDGIPSGKYYSDSTIVDMLPLQKEYNRSRSQIVESKNTMSRPQLVAQKGSLDARKITSEPGQVIFYQPGFQPPTPLPLQNLPPYVLDELDRILGDFNDISGQHEISRGSNPTGVTAATALSYLQEQDDTMLAPIIDSCEDGVCKIGRHFLSHVHQFWDAEHQIAVVGQNRAYETYKFTQKSIKGNTDLNIEAGSAMPRSLAAKQAFILELGKLGWLTPVQGLKYLEMAETGKMYEETQVNYRQAQRENLKMMEGEQIAANSWDEHAEHIEEHNRFRKMQEFESASDEIKIMFEGHVALHRAALGLPPDMNPEQLLKSQELMAGMPGLGSGPGAAPAAEGPGAPGSTPEGDMMGGEQPPPPNPEPSGDAPPESGPPT